MDLLRCSCNPIMSSRLVLRFPQVFCNTESSTHASLFTKIWRLQDLTYQYGRIKKCHFAHLVKLDDSPALAVLHPLEMRKYPLIHDLGMLSLGRRFGSQKAKGTTPRRERLEMKKYLYQNQAIYFKFYQYHPHPHQHSGGGEVPKT